MVKRFNTENFRWTNIIRQLQKTGKTTKVYQDLWNYCAALREFDFHIPADVNVLFSYPIRGFSTIECINGRGFSAIDCINGFPEKRDLLITGFFFTPTNLRLMYSKRFTFSHYFFHIGLGWQSIIHITGNSEQRSILNEMREQLKIIVHYFRLKPHEIKKIQMKLTIITIKAIQEYTNQLIKLRETMTNEKKTSKKS